MKRLGLTILFAAVTIAAAAQGRDFAKEFASFRKDSEAKYAEFRAKANAEYADFLAKAWEGFPVKVPEKQPEFAPIVPPVFNEDIEIEIEEFRVDDIEFPEPAPLKPIPLLEVPKKPAVQQKPNFHFYGIDLFIHADESLRSPLKKVGQASVSSLWKAYSGPKYDALVADCIRAGKEYALCDWAYFELCEEAARKVYGSDCDAAVVLTCFLMTQSGYDVRLAEMNEKLFLVFACDDKIYQRRTLDIDGRTFVFADETVSLGFCKSYKQGFPGGKPMTMEIAVIPDFPDAEGTVRTISPEGNPDIRIPVHSNRNLIDFYNSYPACRWDMYARANMSPALKDTFYPVLRKAIAGKSQEEAANVLLDFAQTGFEYATDDEQFGGERSLFCDESVHYPFNDCEDRSILFSALVRDLLGLEVVLVYYPGHLATAVHFTEKVEGDALIAKGVTYIICDPTYLGAPVGMTMEGMDNSQAKLYLL